MRSEADSPAVEPQARPYPRGAPAAADFPGCRPISIRCDQIATYEGRFELWDAGTETAWVVREPTSDTHEHPSQRLAGLGQLIAAARGSPIECLGAMDLLLRNESGERRRILQADQSVYLHPGRDRLPDGAGMTVGEHDFPDVVLEVDHTTDVRRGKLWFYEEWGFPEVWVEVPERRARSRAPGRRAGLTIHLREDGGYREGLESRAFPGWTAGEIHTAMNEPVLSVQTSLVLDRVGRALGARDGTGPDDMPWLRMHRREGHAKGRAEGLAEGRVKGRTEGLAEGQARGRAELVAAFIRKTLASRGLPVAEFPLEARELVGVTDEEIIDALLQCEDASDLRARLQDLRR